MELLRMMTIPSLGIHIRGLINELYLDDLKKKTMRGLEGQKLRGFSAGEKVYGYKSQPIGELRLNKKGQPKYEGMKHAINEEEASNCAKNLQEVSCRNKHSPHCSRAERGQDSDQEESARRLGDINHKSNLAK